MSTQQPPAGEESSPPPSILQARAKPSKGSAFWLSMVAVVVTVFLSAMDLTAVSTALPTITNDLKGGDEFTWIGSAYALSSTAILPLSGSLADIFGRRPIMLISVAFFAVGSALAGAAQNMNMLIAARSKDIFLSLPHLLTFWIIALSHTGNWWRRNP